MGKNGPSKNPMQNEHDTKPSRRLGHDILRLATLCGILALLAVTFLIWLSINRIQTSLDGRLMGIENRLAQISGRMDTVAALNQPQRRGPDPNRVYTINTAGAPAKGPATAPVIIAEFSDFQ